MRESDASFLEEPRVSLSFLDLAPYQSHTRPLLTACPSPLSHRVLGIQEPASVIFSLANGWMHYRGFREISRRVLPGNPLRPWLLAWSAIGINTWVWSTIFHIRGEPYLGSRSRHLR